MYGGERAVVLTILPTTLQKLPRLDLAFFESYPNKKGGLLRHPP